MICKKTESQCWAPETNTVLKITILQQEKLMGFLWNCNCLHLKSVNTTVLIPLFLSSPRPPGTALGNASSLWVRAFRARSGEWIRVGGGWPQWGIKRTKTRNGRNNTSGLLVWKNRGSLECKRPPKRCCFFFSCPFQSKSQRLCLRPIHALWQVLAREAEFWRSKFPPRKYEHVSPWVLGSLEGWMHVNSAGKGLKMRARSWTACFLGTPRLGRRDLGDSVTSEHRWHALLKKLVIAVGPAFQLLLKPPSPSLPAQPGISFFFFPIPPAPAAAQPRSLVYI